VLPGATLEEVGARIREEVCSGCVGDRLEAAAREVEARKAAVARPRKVVSQETFDEVVRENVEDLEMDLEEAMKDAVQQFLSQGVDLSGLITSLEAKAVFDAVGNVVSEVDAAVKADGGDGETVMQAVKKLRDVITPGNDEKFAAGRHGAVGAAAFICKKFQDDAVLCTEALELLGDLFVVAENREICPIEGIQSIVHCLEKQSDLSDLQAAGFKALHGLIAKHEGNKRNAKDAGVNAALLRVFREHADDHDTFSKTCKFLRTYLNDDDRREGVQPGTFARARELGEDQEEGAMKPLINFLERPSSLEDHQKVVVALSTMRAVAVNDVICQNFATKGGLEQSLLAFEAHISEESVAYHSCMLVKAVARNDDIKRMIGKGKGLGLILRALEEHSESVKVNEQALGCLSTLCLRQPDNCELIAELGCLQLIVSSMNKHQDRPGVQRPAIATLRNMVSSWRNKDLATKILDAGAEELIRKARQDHPELCEEVAYAALRDLGCSYH